MVTGPERVWDAEQRLEELEQRIMSADPVEGLVLAIQASALALHHSRIIGNGSIPLPEGSLHLRTYVGPRESAHVLLAQGGRRLPRSWANVPRRPA